MRRDGCSCCLPIAPRGPERHLAARRAEHPDRGTFAAAAAAVAVAVARLRASRAAHSRTVPLAVAYTVWVDIGARPSASFALS
jgi:hypothetical protein